MWRSEPHTPVASTRTIASSRARSSGSGRSSTRTSPGAWKVTACISPARYLFEAARPPGAPQLLCPRVTDAFYLLEGDQIVASELTRGPWDPDSQHAGPP